MGSMQEPRKPYRSQVRNITFPVTLKHLRESKYMNDKKLD
jgi:hypothetical protein